MKKPDYNILQKFEKNKGWGWIIAGAGFLIIVIILYFIFPSGDSAQTKQHKRLSSGKPTYLKHEPDSTRFTPYSNIKSETERPQGAARIDTGFVPPSPSKLFGKGRAKRLKAQTAVDYLKQSNRQGSRQRNRRQSNGSGSYDSGMQNRQDNKQKIYKEAKKSSLFAKHVKPEQPKRTGGGNRRLGNNQGKDRNGASEIQRARQLDDQMKDALSGLNSPLGVGGRRPMNRDNYHYPNAGQEFQHSRGRQRTAQFQSPRTPYTIQEGTLIPATLVTGITSDLPGDIIAIVNRNVYDSIHEKYLLIPKGTKLIGSYDNSIVINQHKLLMSWKRMIFPDGRSLNIPNLNSYDLQGESGLSGKVNKHFWHIFGQSALLALIGAAASVATHPNQQSGYFNQNQGIGQITAQQIATNFNRVSNRVLRRNLNQPPTIHIREGKRFNIYLAGDISFKQPYSYQPPR